MSARHTIYDSYTVRCECVKRLGLFRVWRRRLGGGDCVRSPMSERDRDLAHRQSACVYPILSTQRCSRFPVESIESNANSFPHDLRACRRAGDVVRAFAQRGGARVEAAAGLRRHQARPVRALATVAMASRIRAVPSPSTVRIALGTLNERMPLPSRLPQVQARLAVDARPQPLPQGEPDRDAKGRAHL